MAQIFCRIGANAVQKIKVVPDWIADVSSLVPVFWSAQDQTLGNWKEICWNGEAEQRRAEQLCERCGMMKEGWCGNCYWCKCLCASGASTTDFDWVWGFFFCGVCCGCARAPTPIRDPTPLLPQPHPHSAKSKFLIMISFHKSTLFGAANGGT